MSEFKYGYGPPVEPQYQQPQPQQYQPQQAYQGPSPGPAPDTNHLVCDHCGDFIEGEDQAVDFYIGLAGISEKSGMPAVVPDPANGPQGGSATLHVYCLPEFVRENVYDDCSLEVIEEEINARVEEELRVRGEPQFCAGCEAKLSGS